MSRGQSRCLRSVRAEPRAQNRLHTAMYTYSNNNTPTACHGQHCASLSESRQYTHNTLALRTLMRSTCPGYTLARRPGVAVAPMREGGRGAALWRTARDTCDVAAPRCPSPVGRAGRTCRAGVVYAPCCCASPSEGRAAGTSGAGPGAAAVHERVPPSAGLLRHTRRNG